MTNLIGNFEYHKKDLTFDQIVELTGAKLIVPVNYIGNKIISSVASLKNATSEDICFFNNMDYLDDLQQTKAGACLIAEKFIDKAPSNLVLLVVKDAYRSFALISGIFYVMPSVTESISTKASIHSTAIIGANSTIADFAVIGKNVVIGENTYIGPNVILHDNVKIGNNTYIYGNTSIKYAVIGNDCIFHEGIRIGQDGFGFAPSIGGHVKIPQIGSVVIHDDVEIGSNTCIDRGTTTNTVIGEGTKIDNMVQIAHGVNIGKYCFLAAQVGIAGSAIIEDYVSVGGHTGIAPHSLIRTGTQIAPMSGVDGETEANSVLMGYPAINFRSFWKLQAIFKRILNNKIKI